MTYNEFDKALDDLIQRGADTTDAFNRDDVANILMRYARKLWTAEYFKPPSKDTKMLLVWEEVGDKTTLYLIDSQSQQAKWAIASAGMYINGDDVNEGDPLDLLNNWLNSPQGAEHKLQGLYVNHPVDSVVVCGFIL